MLKFFFYALLAANGLLLAFHQGYLEALIPSGREPGRVARQFNADKIKLVSAPASPVPVQEAVAPEPDAAMATVAAKQAPPACIEIGNFTLAEGKRVEAQLAALSPAGKVSRREIQEISSSMVFIPPQDGKDGADKKAVELRALGINDFYIIQDNNEQRWGISLGIFRTEEAARAHLAALNRQGLRNARLIGYKTPLNRVAFQLREPDADLKAEIDKIKKGFPRREIRNCG